MYDQIDTVTTVPTDEKKAGGLMTPHLLPGSIALLGVSALLFFLGDSGIRLGEPGSALFPVGLGDAVSTYLTTIHPWVVKLWSVALGLAGFRDYSLYSSRLGGTVLAGVMLGWAVYLTWTW